MKQRDRTSILAALGMIVLILDAKTALSGAREGIDLCMRTVIPALFPFFILSIILTGSLAGARWKLLKPIGTFLRIPRGSESLYLIGLLGGYPTGAQVVATAYQDGILQKRDAIRMLGFCSNAGPSFLFGMAASQFSSVSSAWLLWGILILSSALTGYILPGKANSSATPPKQQVNLSVAFDRSLKAITRVCGWVILFRVLLSFCNRWFAWLLDTPVMVLFNGALELTIGCSALAYIDNESVRFIICGGMLSFGGICVILQTCSVTGALGLGMYLHGKLIQTAITVLLCCVASSLLFHSPVDLIILCSCCFILAAEIIFLRKVEKGIAIQHRLLYNPA